MKEWLTCIIILSFVTIFRDRTRDKTVKSRVLSFYCFTPILTVKPLTKCSSFLWFLRCG